MSANLIGSTDLLILGLVAMVISGVVGVVGALGCLYGLLIGMCYVAWEEYPQCQPRSAP